MTLEEVFIEAKLNNKLSVFTIFYLKKDKQIGGYKVSFFDYNEEKIFNEMKKIECSNVFERWLSLSELNKFKHHERF